MNKTAINLSEDKQVLRSLTKSVLIDNLFGDSDIFGSSNVVKQGKLFTSKTSEEALSKPLFSNNHFEPKSFKAPERKVSTVTVPLMVPPRRKSSAASVSTVVSRQSTKSSNGSDIFSGRVSECSDGDISIYSSSVIKVPIAELPLFDFEQKNNIKTSDARALKSFEDKYGSLKAKVEEDQSESDIWKLTQNKRWRLTYMRPPTIFTGANSSDSIYESPESAISWSQISSSGETCDHAETVNRVKMHLEGDSNSNYEALKHEINHILEEYQSNHSMNYADLSGLLEIVNARIQMSECNRTEHLAIKDRLSERYSQQDVEILEIIDLYMYDNTPKQNESSMKA